MSPEEKKVAKDFRLAFNDFFKDRQLKVLDGLCSHSDESEDAPAEAFAGAWYDAFDEMPVIRTLEVSRESFVDNFKRWSSQNLQTLKRTVRTISYHRRYLTSIPSLLPRLLKKCPGSPRKIETAINHTKIFSGPRAGRLRK